MDDRALIELALAQHGLVTRQQAKQVGATDSSIRRRLETGTWRRLRSGVYIVGAAATTWQQRVMGACIAGGPEVVASHRTAARLWELVDRSGRIEVTVASERRLHLHGVQTHRSILLPPIDRTRRLAIPTTTPARTIIDASAHQPVPLVGRWIDEALRMKVLTLAELRCCAARLAGPGRRDLSAVRAALSERLPGYDPGDSELEVRALRAIAAAGLPAPEQQLAVRLPDGTTVRIDLAFPEDLLAIELDGWEYHGQRRAFDRDRARRNQLTLLGWRVLQFTAAMTDRTLVEAVTAGLGALRPSAPCAGA